MNTILTKISVGILTAIVAFAGFLGFVPVGQKIKVENDFINMTASYQKAMEEQKERLDLLENSLNSLGATIPVVTAVFETSLASKISSSATSMLLTTATDSAGNGLSGYICLSIDEGLSNEEFVCGTASGSTISSLVRGISPTDGDLEVTALKQEHRRGASVKITNYPQLAILSRILNGDETLPNAIKYASEPSWTYGQHQLVSWDKAKDYMDALTIAGAANGDTITKGIYEMATTAETLLGTATGSTGAYLIVPNSLFDDDSSAKNIVPVTGSDGKLSQGFIDLTENYTWTGTHYIAQLLATTSASLAQTYISGNLNVIGTTTFSGAPSYASDPVYDSNLARKAYVDPKPVSAAGTKSGTPYTTSSTSYVVVDPEFSKTVYGLTVGDVMKIYYNFRIKSRDGGNYAKVKLIDATNNKDILSEYSTSTTTPAEVSGTVYYVSPSAGNVNFQLQFMHSVGSDQASIENITNAVTLGGCAGFIIIPAE